MLALTIKSNDSVMNYSSVGSWWHISYTIIYSSQIASPFQGIETINSNPHLIFSMLCLYKDGRFTFEKNNFSMCWWVDSTLSSINILPSVLISHYSFAKQYYIRKICSTTDPFDPKCENVTYLFCTAQVDLIYV